MITSTELANQLRAELDRATATMRHIADMIEALDVASPRMVDVPYISQWDAIAQKFKSDCGPACVAMLLAAKGVWVSVDDLAVECGMGPGKPYTLARDLAKCASKHGLKLEPVSGWTISQFAEHVPCIALVHYGSIPDRLDRNYTAGHWVVIVGISEVDVIFHDPDYHDASRDRGANRRIPRSVFEQAMQDCRLDQNPAGYGLVMVNGGN